ncbi:hypothetical protein OV203_23455 [Nannocystis sp. ILAH1]|uniref:hypothetical protein n=1 Tax=unclassified Nannocystis TaxID=2627009 RepID=UPI00226DD974|nr:MULTISPECIES: hypothetical protein [unclassified Nannocystis]MCY0990116.1 hypothetical protein [Nannocystis sp. ILAH1]MCY1069595.1 hypothetical protein [Nannocystis sp. RBIL2]
MAFAVADFPEQVAALKHDLGKYVAWMSANLGDDHWHGPLRDELVEALRRDLLRTRSGGDGTVEAAWELWTRFAADWPRPLPAPELVEVEAAVEVLRAHSPALARGDRDAIAAARPQIRAAQQTIRSELQKLHRRLQSSRG